MFNKESCRHCGSELKVLKICNTCQEDIRWVCKDCKFFEEYIHYHPRDLKQCAYC